MRSKEVALAFFILITLGVLSPHITLSKQLMSNLDCSCCVLRHGSCKDCKLNGHKMGCHRKSKKVTPSKVSNEFPKITKTNCSSNDDQILSSLFGDVVLIPQTLQISKFLWEKELSFSSPAHLLNRGIFPSSKPPAFS